jgi:hypothetical protein
LCWVFCRLRGWVGGMVRASCWVMVRRLGGRWALTGVFLGWVGLAGCAGATGRDPAEATTTGDLGAEVYPGSNGEASTPPVLGDAALGATWQELGVPGVGNRPALASTPRGWFAVSRRSVGDGKAPSAWESYLYRSADGVGWQRVEISAQNENLWLRGVAYGAGHYVLAGTRFGVGGGDVIFDSVDAEHWDEIPVVSGAPSGLSGLVFVGGRFFALSTNRTLITSANGRAWTSVDLGNTTVMPLDVTFGHDQYLLVGSGNIQRSSNGLDWQPTALDCAMPGACISNPDGDVLQSVHYRAVFADGTYFIDQASSVDGQTWQSLPGLYPEARVEGYVLGSSTDERLVIWEPGGAARPLANVKYIETLSDANRAERMRWNGAVDPIEFSSENFPDGAPPPDAIEFPLPSGADCRTSRCAIVGERLFLVSPAP